VVWGATAKSRLDEPAAASATTASNSAAHTRPTSPRGIAASAPRTAAAAAATSSLRGLTSGSTTDSATCARHRSHSVGTACGGPERSNGGGADGGGESPVA
jgi:hypothetical protein